MTQSKLINQRKILYCSNCKLLLGYYNKEETTFYNFVPNSIFKKFSRLGKEKNVIVCKKCSGFKEVFDSDTWVKSIDKNNKPEIKECYLEEEDIGKCEEIFVNGNDRYKQIPKDVWRIIQSKELMEKLE